MITTKILIPGFLSNLSLCIFITRLTELHNLTFKQKMLYNEQENALWICFRWDIFKNDINKLPCMFSRGVHSFNRRAGELVHVNASWDASIIRLLCLISLFAQAHNIFLKSYSACIYLFSYYFSVLRTISKQSTTFLVRFRTALTNPSYSAF